MTRVKLPGIAKVKGKLADGTIRTYYYAWRGGPLLKAKDGRPLQPHEPAFARAYHEARKEMKAVPKGTLSALITEFKASADYVSKSEKTKREYNRYLDMIREEFGDMALAAVQDQGARGEFKEWRDTMADRPRTADYAWTTLARVLSFARDRGRISVNVCEKGGRIYAADRTEKIWGREEISSFMAFGSPEMRLALLMALWTGQRQADLLKAAWNAYDGKTLRIKQGKTGARVAIPVGSVLKQALDAAPRVAATILATTRKTTWTSDGFRSSWSRACEVAKVKGLTFHDLRGTAVTRLALAGCTTSQIASITGHSLKDVDSILDTHYLGGKFELAEQAINKLEEHVAGT